MTTRARPDAVPAIATRITRHPLIVLILMAGVVLGAVSQRADGRTSRSSTAAHPFAYRYLFSSRPVARTAAAYGWNLIDVSEKSEADNLPNGTRGLIWVGDYDNSSCSWEMSDADLTRQVKSMVGDEKVAGFYFSDEPDPAACPQAPGQHAVRSKLIRRLDPAVFTVMVASSNSDNSPAELHLWSGAATYVGLDPYPCERGKACDFSAITRMIKAAERAHIAYWAVVQGFADRDWRWPTPRELARMLSIWQASRAQGSMTFSWTWDSGTLANHPGLLAVFKRFNKTG